MAEQVKFVMDAFGRGMATFLRPWNRACTPVETPRRDISRYFAAVGKYISNAERRFAQEHPEVAPYAH